MDFCGLQGVYIRAVMGESQYKKESRVILGATLIILFGNIFWLGD